MEQDKDAEIDALKTVIAAKDAVIAAKDAVITAKDAEITAKDAVITAKDAEIMESLDFSIQAVTEAVTLLRINGRCDLADALVPILNQLKERRYFCNGQVAHQFYRPRGVDTITAEMEDTTIAGSNIPGEASNKAPGAMVQDSTKSSSGTGDRRSKGGRYKDLEHAILDLHLRVALLTV